MRRCSGLVLALIVAVTASVPEAWSNTPNPADTAPGAMVAAPEKPPLSPLAQAIIDKLVVLKAAARSRPAAERTQIDKLIALYRHRDGKTFWINNDAIAGSARSVAKEIRLADQYGLDTTAFDIPEKLDGEMSLANLAETEARLSVAVVKYAWHAGGGRVDPSQLSKWLDQRPKPVDPAVVLPLVAGSKTPDVMLRLYQPQHPGFERLRRAWLAALGGQPFVLVPPAQAVLNPGPKLRPGDDHPDIPLIRQRLGLKAPAAADDELYDNALARAVRALRSEIGRPVNAVIDNGIRESLNARVNAPARGLKNPELARKLHLNMERWRWLPGELGATHIWNNLPEYETRVVKDDKVVHQERIIIGKPETQTPVFSDRLRTVVFQPDWGVPPSIKVRTILPRLQDGDEEVLNEKNMRIVVNGKTMDPSKYDWDKVDIRGIPIIQDPGPDNPLGQIKFLFPNKHDVYMHDTPSKNLFNGASRALSNGCVRVRNPRRLAELVMAEDRGWTDDDITPLLAPKSQANNRVTLAQPIAVHNVYFTAVVGDDGKIKTFGDIYAHDKRIQEALDGRPIAEIAERDPAKKLEEELEDIAPTKPAQPPPKPKAKSRS